MRFFGPLMLASLMLGLLALWLGLTDPKAALWTLGGAFALWLVGAVIHLTLRKP